MSTKKSNIKDKEGDLSSNLRDTAIAAAKNYLGIPYCDKAFSGVVNWASDSSPFYHNAKDKSYERIKKQKVVCSGLLNLIKPTPLPSSFLVQVDFKGGTYHWGLFLNNKLKPVNQNTYIEKGDLLFTPYKSDLIYEQGHIGIAATSGLINDVDVIHCAWDYKDDAGNVDLKGVVLQNYGKQIKSYLSFSYFCPFNDWYY